MLISTLLKAPAAFLVMRLATISWSIQVLIGLNLLTFSLSEKFSNESHAYSFIKKGGQVAIVFRNELPPVYWIPRHLHETFTVVDGDSHDCIWTHDGGLIIGLRAKGKARIDNTGFVKDT